MKGLAFLFPGQGSQYVGMGQGLVENFAIARETFEEANRVLGFDLMKLCFEGDLEELTKTENAQPAILTTSVAAFRVLENEFQITPEYLAGHSLGEYSALVCAGALSFADALQLVRKRGQFMQEAVPVGVGAMMAVMKLSHSEVIEICGEATTQEEKVVPANYNSKNQVVISGHENAVLTAGNIVIKAGGMVKELNVSAPFHSPLMAPAAEKMQGELEKVQFNKMQWPVVANVTAMPNRSADGLVELLTEQITAPVRWYETMEYLHNQGIQKAVEIGPKKVLQNLMKRSFSEIQTVGFEKQEQLETLREFLPKPDLMQVIRKCLAVSVSTRNRNEDTEAYQKGVVEPYRQIAAIKEELTESETAPTQEQATVALELLKTILETKQVPIVEQQERFTEIFEDSGTTSIFIDFVV